MQTADCEKKNQTDISNIEDQVLSMYAKGMTTRDISAHLKDVYGVDASAENDITYDRSNLLSQRMAKPAALERRYAVFYGLQYISMFGRTIER